jgi:RNA polymerase sigma-70 factor (ECF subfamily)
MPTTPHNGRDDTRLAVAGDADALVRLLARYGPAVRRTIRNEIPAQWRTLLSEDDVMQESYAEAFLGVRQLSPEGSFLAWLRRIAKNNLLDAVKGLKAERRGGNRKRVEGAHGEDAVLSLFDVLDDGGTTPSGRAMRGELGEVFDRALARLPDAYREVVRLYDLEMRGADEVARLLGCSPGAVYMRRARAQEMLREILGAFSNYG